MTSRDSIIFERDAIKIDQVWGVVATHPSGQQEHILGFHTEVEAMEWRVSQGCRAWLKTRGYVGWKLGAPSRITRSRTSAATSRSIAPCERLLLITERDKPTGKLADHHPVKNAGDLQFVLVGRYGLNAIAFIVMLAGLDSRHFFVLGSRSTCSLSSLHRPVIAEIEEKFGVAGPFPAVFNTG